MGVCTCCRGGLSSDNDGNSASKRVHGEIKNALRNGALRSRARGGAGRTIRLHCASRRFWRQQHAGLRFAFGRSVAGQARGAPPSARLQRYRDQRGDQRRHFGWNAQPNRFRRSLRGRASSPSNVAATTTKEQDFRSPTITAISDRWLAVFARRELRSSTWASARRKANTTMPGSRSPDTPAPRGAGGCCKACPRNTSTFRRPATMPTRLVKTSSPLACCHASCARLARRAQTSPSLRGFRRFRGGEFFANDVRPIGVGFRQRAFAVKTLQFADRLLK